MIRSRSLPRGATPPAWEARPSVVASRKGPFAWGTWTVKNQVHHSASRAAGGAGASNGMFEHTEAASARMAPARARRARKQALPDK